MTKKKINNNKINRRENDNLEFFSKSNCKNIKCNIPGEKSKHKFKHSDYGLILRQKQKIKRYYCLFEKQFKKLFLNIKNKFFKYEKIINILERRLDNIVYRMNFSITRKDARQSILHGFVYVNFKIVNSPSFLISPGDYIIVKNFFKKKFLYDCKNFFNFNWLFVDYFKEYGIFLSLPNKNKFFIDKNLIIDLYK